MGFSDFIVGLAIAIGLLEAVYIEEQNNSGSGGGYNNGGGWRGYNNDGGRGRYNNGGGWGGYNNSGGGCGGGYCRCGCCGGHLYFTYGSFKSLDSCSECILSLRKPGLLCQDGLQDSVLCNGIFTLLVQSCFGRTN